MPSLPRSASSPLAGFVLVLALVVPVQAQPSGPLVVPPEAAPSPTRFVHWAYQDAFAFVRGMAEPTTWLYLTGTAAVLYPVARLDGSINPRALAWRDGRLGGYLEWTNHLGGPRMTLPVATVAVATLFTDDTRLQDAAFTSLESLLAAGAVSYGLKFAFGRARPKAGAGPYRFDPFSGHTSFPSGHSTTAFAVLTPWVFYYPGPVTYGLFALGTGTAVARLARNKHWTTDVIAGSGIGVLMGYWLTRRHQGRPGFRALPDRLSIRPAVTPNGAYVTLKLSLDRSR